MSVFLTLLLLLLLLLLEGRAVLRGGGESDWEGLSVLTLLLSVVLASWMMFIFFIN